MIQGILLLAELSNFSKTADTLNITQPAFSRMISRAEEELGFKIFFRTTQTVKLTREGEAFVPSLRQAENIYKSAVSYSKEMLAERSRLILGVTANFVSFELSPCLVKFAMEHPQIYFDCIPMQMGEIPVKLRNNGIDIGVLFTERTRFSSEFTSQILKKIPLDVVVNKSHPLAQKSLILASDLENENLIALRKDIGNYDFESYGEPFLMLNKRHGTHLKPKIIAMGTQDQLMRVACNRGITLLTSTLKDIIPKNTLIIPLKDGPIFNLTAIWKRHHEESGVMAEFLDILAVP
jgi:DNA-binding transcriptional LysR family regulator